MRSVLLRLLKEYDHQKGKVIMLIGECGAVETDASGKELVTHGNSQFPLAIYHDHLEIQDVDWHWHDELELIYQIDGEGLFIMNDKKIVLHKGEGLFINSEVLHGCWETELHHSDICSLVFHTRLAGGGNESIYWQKYLEPLIHNTAFSYYHFQGDEANYAQQIRATWEVCLEGQEGYEFSVRSGLSELLFFLYQKQSNNQKRLSPGIIRNRERIKAMLNYIHTFYSEPIKLSDIAKSALISESECLRCFRTMINTSPGQYLKSYRIQKACEFLKNTSCTIREIGELCGFSDESYFVKQFREEKGMTPGGFRNL